MVLQKSLLLISETVITRLIINNGLRASNIIELTLKDVKEASAVTGYEGHRVLTNQKYKTLTLYAEKNCFKSTSWSFDILYRESLSHSCEKIVIKAIYSS